MTTLLSGGAAVLLYLLSSALLALRLSRGSAGRQQSKTAPLVIGLAALALHGVVLYQATISAEGINLGLFNAVSLVAWLIVLLLLISSFSQPIENLGILVQPIAALTILLEFAYPTQRLIGQDTPLGIEAHIFTSILSYSVLSLAAVQAILLAIQDRHLRNRHPGGFIRALPPLQIMESLLFQMIWLGFVLLSISLLTGLLFVEDLFAQHLVHKTVLSIASWGVFVTLLWGRHRFGWRGRVAIRWTLTGLVVLAVAYFGSKLVLEVLLR
ncbi:MAG: inner membrane protein YpjD [Gammaproteobacteria bacterium]